MQKGIRRLNLETPKNLRDLGGYMRKDQKVTKFCEFLRGDCMNGLTEGDIEFLKEYGLKTVIDLRTPEELLRQSNDFEHMQEFNYINLPVFETEEIFLGENGTMGDLYISMLNTSKNFGRIFNYMAENPKGALLFHCTAGKDRTGIISCILLMLAGIETYDIIADYQISFTYFKQSFMKQLEINPDMPMHFAESRPEWIEEFIETLLDQYKTVENFLLEKGVLKENIEILKNKII